MNAKPVSQSVEDLSTAHLEALIAERTGLRLRPRQRELLRAYLSTRLAALQSSQIDAYYEFLLADGVAAQAEWDRLVSPLLNKESYFFRDKGQMALLRDQILPEVIQRNLATRTLRIWSAGCSTGEEAYSLAVLVDELLSERGDSSKRPWDVRILGTDIDEQAIRFARRGVYGAWSFRMVPSAVRERWFRKEGDGWRVDQAPRSAVRFERCNLVNDKFPSEGTGLSDIDLILCRNVFIYFVPEAVSSVLSKFALTLRVGGYLMMGHVETCESIPPPLRARNFPESEIYQRCDSLTPVAETSSVAKEQLPVSDTSRRDAADFPSLSQKVATNSNQTTDPREPEKALASAQAFADIGCYEEAIADCMTYLEANPFASEPYELLSSIALEQGRNEDAKVLLKKALYLSPSSPHLYIKLGDFYECEKDELRAKKMFLTALELLGQMPRRTLIGSDRAEDVAATVTDYIARLNDFRPEGA
jgi:chemotaxis protein methyltransferase CheR